jgi:dTDP-4-amino-4,6-dideoxygalactose transaminase
LRIRRGLDELEVTTVKVPLLDLNQQNLALARELESAFSRVLHSGRFILGPEVEKFEHSAAELVGARHAIGVSSGTDAILLALMALGIGPGDEVICPSFTFFATAGCIARAGATPVFADSCPVCFNLDVEDAARKITARTRAIMPVHLFGQAAEMDAVMDLAAAHPKIAVIEDAAQALGAQYRGRGAGSIGDFGTFSFYPSKNLGGFGDSGLLVTSNDALAAEARLLRTHGAEHKYFHKKVGGNFRVDPLQTALLSVKLPHLVQYSEGRRRNAAFYSSQLVHVPGVCANPNGSRCVAQVRECSRPEKVGIVLPAAYPHNHHIWNQYTLRVVAGEQWNLPGNPRDILQKFLTAREIGAEIYYPRPMHLQECFAEAAKNTGKLPVAESLANECLSVPIFPELTRQQLETVCAAIRDFMADHA